MVEIIEGSLHIQFGKGVNAIKFDETQWHKNQMRSSLKAMDILAICPSNDEQEVIHWWIEIKNCLGSEEANEARMTRTDLPEVVQTLEWVFEKGWKPKVAVAPRKPYIVDEIIAKVRDTIASLTIAAQFGDQEVGAFVAGPKQRPRIVFLLCWEIKDFKRLATRLQEKLATALEPYGLEGIVIGPHQTIPGFDCKINSISTAKGI